MIHSIPSRARIFILTLILFFSSRPVNLNATGQPVETSRESKSLTTESIPFVVSRGPHDRVVEWTATVSDGSGADVVFTNSYTEIATGMHYRDSNGEWRDTVPAFEPEQGGWVAARGPHQVALAVDLSVPGAMTLVTPEGRTLRSTPTLLAYHDTASGATVRLADLKPTRGEWVAANEILYPDAFDTVAADVRAVYTASGFESDIVLRRQLPDPALFEMNPDTTEVAVYTEFFDTIPDSAEGQFFPSPDGSESQDLHLTFGSMIMDRGRAFSLEGDHDPVPVRKSWETIEGRTFLIELTRYAALQPLLEELPGASNPSPSDRRASGRLKRTARIEIPVQSGSRPVWTRTAQGRLASGTQSEPSVQTANHDSRRRKPFDRGVVLDYSIVNSQVGYTFDGKSTYYVSGPVTFGWSTNVPDWTWTVHFNAGTVIKFAKTNSAALFLDGRVPLDWLGAPYRPVTLTALDDDSVGQVLPGSTGIPVGVYAAKALRLNGSAQTSPTTLTNLAVRHAAIGVEGINYNSAQPLTIRHAQFVHCGAALYLQMGSTNTNSFYLENALIFSTNSGIAFQNLYYAKVAGEYVTVDGCAALRQGIYNPDYSSVALTNSLIVGVGNTSNVALVGSKVYSSSTIPTGPIFTTAGSGAHYLNFANSELALFIVDAPPQRPALTNDFQFATVRPPTQLPSLISANQILFPDPEHGDSEAFHGYHYWVVDYLATGVTVTNASVTISNQAPVGFKSGTVVAGIGTNAFFLRSGSKWISHGRPENLNRLCWASAVQELPTAGPPASIIQRNLIDVATGTSVSPEIWFRLSKVDVSADTSVRRGLVNLSLSGQSLAVLNLRDSHFTGTGVNWAPATAANQSFTLFNNVFEDSTVSAYRSGPGQNAVLARQNLFWDSNLTLYYSFIDSSGNPVWTCTDNLFDGTAPSAYPVATNYLWAGWNGYTGPSATLGGSGNKLSLVPNYEAGPLGAWYYPASGSATSLFALVNAGSRSATNAGLYHYSVFTNGAIENNGTVDIGFHYLPRTDTDGDGVSDFLEDRNGNGLTDPDETSYTSYDSDGDGISDRDEPTGYVASFGLTSGAPDETANSGTGTSYLVIAAGAGHNLAIREGGQVVAWGTNAYGQTNVPSGANKGIDVAGGERHSLALTETGVILAWGDNTWNQKNVPSPNTNFTAIAAGFRHNLALKDDGTVRGWGENSYNQTNPPPGLNNVIQVAAGQWHSLALKSDGIVVPWGRNDLGQCTVPNNATNVVEIAAGWTHSLALRADGRVIAWGDNTGGATSVPTSLTNALHVAAGQNFSVALRNDGTLLAWGSNAYGQTNIPASLTNLQAIAAGQSRVLALPYCDSFDYPVDLKRDFLLVVNTNSTASTNVGNYYIAHRPGMLGNTNIVKVGVDNISESILATDVDANVLIPISSWMTNNPTKRPRYLLLSCEFPQIVFFVSSGYFESSFQDRLRRLWPGRPPVIGALNMKVHNCTNYVLKLEQLGKVVPGSGGRISASRGAYNNQLFCLDSHSKTDSYPLILASSALWNYDLVTANLWYVPNGQPRIAKATNVAAYASWGKNGGSPYTATWAIDGTVDFYGDSGWWICQSIESWNGQWNPNEGQGSYRDWFAAGSFGGSNYSRTPVGGVQQVYEPRLGGVHDTTILFGLWSKGRTLGTAAWKSAKPWIPTPGITPLSNPSKQSFNALTGDPLVSR